MRYDILSVPILTVSMARLQLQVIAALHRDNENSEARMKEMQLDVRKMQDEMESFRNSVKIEYSKKLDDLQAVLTEKESAYKVMQQEFSVIKDFRVQIDETEGLTALTFLSVYSENVKSYSMIQTSQRQNWPKLKRDTKK